MRPAQCRRAARTRRCVLGAGRSRRCPSPAKASCNRPRWAWAGAPGKMGGRHAQKQRRGSTNVVGAVYLWRCRCQLAALWPLVGSQANARVLTRAHRVRVARRIRLDCGEGHQASQHVTSVTCEEEVRAGGRRGLARRAAAASATIADSAGARVNPGTRGAAPPPVLRPRLRRPWKGRAAAARDEGRAHAREPGQGARVP